MPRPPKTLLQHLQDGTFMAGRHGDLLLGELIGPPRLREVQARYQDADGSRKPAEKEVSRLTLSRKTLVIGAALLAIAVIVVLLVVYSGGGGSGGGGY